MSVIATVAGSAILKKLAPIILKAGAPILADIVKDNVGAGAGKIVESIATRLGVEKTPDAIVAKHESEPAVVEEAIRDIEVADPEYWTYLRDADQIRAAIFRQEAAEPWWAWAWRPAWMWLLAIFWIWLVVIVPIVNMLVPRPLVLLVDVGTLMTLTGIYVGLYMGGHTLKDIGTKAAEAWAARKAAA